MVVKKPLDKIVGQKIDIEELIDRGARVKEDNKEVEKKWSYVNLRLPTQLLNSVDEALGDCVGISRNGWILQAIHEKLKRKE